MTSIFSEDSWNNMSIKIILMLFSMVIILLGLSCLIVVLWGGLPWGNSASTIKHEKSLFILGFVLIISGGLILSCIRVKYEQQGKRNKQSHMLAVSAFLEWHRDSRPDHLDVFQNFISTSYGRGILNGDYDLCVEVAKELNQRGFKMPYARMTKQWFYSQLSSPINDQYNLDLYS